jgi:hypothetical protein
VQAIRDEGFNSVDDLLDIAEDQIDKLVKHIGQWRDTTVANTINFPFLCVQRLKALRWWASLRVRQGIPDVDADAFTNQSAKRP